MSNASPVAENDLENEFKRFVQNPIHRFIVNVRRKRAFQLRKLLSGARVLDSATFEHEVWHLESQTYWHGHEIELQLFDKRNGQSRLEQIIHNTNISLDDLEHALDTGTLELHGNYIWGQGSNRYAPKQTDEKEKTAQISTVIGILNDTALNPIEKAHRIDAVPGFGENNTTGLVMIFHPDEFALVNLVTREVLKKLDSEHASTKSLALIQKEVHLLKESLGARDFIELDWFLYQYSSYMQVAVTDQEKQKQLDYIVRVLENTNEPLGYTEITSRAIALGFETKGKTPARTVSNILTTNPQLFERVGRSTYCLVESDKSLSSGDREEDLLDSEEEVVLTPDYVEPLFSTISTSIREQGMRIDERTLRSYHLALKTGRIVVLAGPSGTGKTWLAQAYADAVAAAPRLISVAPNWTTNEDLLGYTDPLDQSIYHHTDTSQFLLSAAQEYEQAVKLDHTPRPYHLILDEMNLARVEYYFAKFLSIMEVRARKPDQAFINLSPSLTVSLYPNLSFIGTINVDDTTHGFADKVYDRAHVIRLSLSYTALAQAVGDVPYKQMLMRIWEDISPIAPFAFRVVDDIEIYMREAAKLDVPWRESLDDLVQQKILPKVRGFDQKVGIALNKLIESVSKDDLPLSHACVQEMLKGYQDHGTASFF